MSKKDQPNAKQWEKELKQKEKEQEKKAKKEKKGKGSDKEEVKKDVLIAPVNRAQSMCWMR
jgi:hypothetical protein